MTGRILVTGAAGFLGQELLQLLGSSEGSVMGTYLKNPPKHTQAKIRFKRLDILKARETIELFRDFRPRWVYHLAAATSPRHSWTDIEGTFQANVQGTLNILEAARLQDSPVRLFLASTIHVYGRSFEKNQPLDETGTLWPESPYAASKAAAELAVLNYVNAFGIDAVIGRFANSVGRGQPSSLVFPEWCRQIAAIERGKLPPQLETGNLQVSRDFLHAKDTARAMLTIMHQGQSGRVYNVASGRVQKLKQYAGFLLKQSSKKIQLKTEARLKRKNDPAKVSVKTERLSKLGWTPRYRVEEGLRDLLQECRDTKN